MAQSGRHLGPLFRVSNEELAVPVGLGQAYQPVSDGDVQAPRELDDAISGRRERRVPFREIGRVHTRAAKTLLSAFFERHQIQGGVR
jgi:hypothetical protein